SLRHNRNSLRRNSLSRNSLRHNRNSLPRNHKPLRSLLPSRHSRHSRRSRHNHKPRNSPHNNLHRNSLRLNRNSRHSPLLRRLPQMKRSWTTCRSDFTIPNHAKLLRSKRFHRWRNRPSFCG
ncbi:MAG: hypothetical protein IKP87_14860, partial [Victivallales bacterium]|nr:hypothetical protein [Victivallales bacterium]